MLILRGLNHPNHRRMPNPRRYIHHTSFVSSNVDARRSDLLSRPRMIHMNSSSRYPGESCATDAVSDASTPDSVPAMTITPPNQGARLSHSGFSDCSGSFTRHSTGSISATFPASSARRFIRRAPRCRTSASYLFIRTTPSRITVILP